MREVWTASFSPLTWTLGRVELLLLTPIALASLALTHYISRRSEPKIMVDRA